MTSSTALFAVVIDAKHLTIVGFSFATVVPRRDVVRLHFLNLESIATVRTYALLSLKR
jgi:hypothetical protein